MSEFRKKPLPPKVENMSREELLVFLKKKKECESVAQKIVVELLECDITEKQLINCLPHINQCHYEDITEERAIVKLCGYPLCSKHLPDKLPMQQFKISSKTNRVFDITVRKNFCSNFCYRASSFLKEQLLTSPLWCRQIEEMPEFKIMPPGNVGVLGEEINLGIVKVDVVENKDTDFKSLLDFAEATLQEISQDEKNKDLKIDSIEISGEDKNTSDANKETTEVSEATSDEVTKNKESHKNVSEGSNSKLQTLDENPKQVRSKSQKVHKIVGEVVERRSENKIDPIISEGMKMVKSNEKKPELRKSKEPKVYKKSVQPITVAIIHIEKCLGEWFTLESLLFLFGEKRVKEMVTDKGECIKEYLNNMASGLFYKSTSYDQYQQLCRKLNLLELEDKRYDNKVTSMKDLKPLPHYSILQQESQKLSIKVKAFLQGEMEIPQVEEEAKFIRDDKGDDENESVTKFPLVDKTAQNALRRKIVLNGFNKVLPDLLQSLGITFRELNSDLKLLIATFDLQAHNIVFKQIQWNMIAMIIIKLLSIKDLRLGKALEANKAHTHMQLLLMSYEQDGGYLDRVISWLTDVDRLLETTCTQLTNG